MLPSARSGARQAAVQHALDILRTRFAASGAQPLDLPYLYPGDTLLNLYGEDLRARAFVFAAPGQGELCLRPDFTVPVALAHGESGWDRAAAYTYQGPVFRRQPDDADRPVEYLQAGIERFGDPDPVAAEVEVLLQMQGGLSDLGIARQRIMMGDLSIILALLDALDMPAARRAALRRHLWRPRRFQTLLERAVAPPVLPGGIAALIDAAPSARVTSVNSAGEEIGLRTRQDVLERLSRLATQADEAPMPAADAKLIQQVLAVSGPVAKVSATLRQLVEPAGVGIDLALDRFERRLALMTDRGLNADTLEFNAAFGRTLEYYDGFVFEIRADGAGEHPPLAGGGRYDAMTTRLGVAAPVPAVGGIIRPEAVLEAAG